MKALGIVLVLLGITGLLIFGIHMINESRSFNFFGIEVIIHSTNWTPLVISFLVLITGAILIGARRSAKKAKEKKRYIRK